MLKKLWKKWGPNPLDQALRKAQKKGHRKILIPWNRGLGDIALGLFAIVHRIRTFIPDAEITFLTRPDLAEGFTLLGGVNIKVDPSMQRKKPYTVTIEGYDLVLDKADPSHWVTWQRGTLTPRLRWNPAWDMLCERFSLPNGCIAAHVQCETGYYTERDWPSHHWDALFSSVDKPFVLLGRKKDPIYSYPHVIDLRGEMSLFEMLSVIKNRCDALIAPDSGPLSMAYYLDTAFPLRVLSLWADPNHGVLKQNVPSPNPLLHHIPLISPNHKNAALIPPENVQAALSFPPISQQRERLVQKEPPPSVAPLTKYTHAQEKKCDLKIFGTIILAGGQGTRLGATLPKALVPVTPVQQKSLLQLLCEKTLAASRQVGHALPLAIMTSPLNHAEILSFLENHSYFGLTPETVDLFPQEMLPFLDDQGNWIVEAGGKIAQGPDGNGHCLKRFVQTGIYEKWQKRGIEHVHIIPIDNALADPFDPHFFGAHLEQKNDVTIKAILRNDPQEHVGALCLKNGKIGVWEYTERSEVAEYLTLANINLFCLTMPFAYELAQRTLPWHLARKKYRDRFIWKFETFIFDMLDYTEKVGVVVFPREQVYSPLKNAEGERSLKTVQASLLARDRSILQELTGKIPPERPFELSPAFYYPTQELCQTWKGKELPAHDYIEEATV